MVDPIITYTHRTGDIFFRMPQLVGESSLVPNEFGHPDVNLFL